MENFDIDKIKDYTEEDLKIFQSIEEKNIESTEELFKNYLKVPFKDDKKTQQLLDKISSHKNYKDMIKKELREREQKFDQKSDYNWSTLIDHSGFSWIQNPSTIQNFYQQQISGYPVYKTNIHQKIITVTYYDECEKQSFQIEVIDDVFKSELGNYYLSSLSNGNISLNNVIDIEENSNLYKWYQEMCKKFNREQKLNRINN